MTTAILDPTAQPASGVTANPVGADRPVDLAGLTVGLLDNGKRNAGLFVDELGAVLTRRYGVARLVIDKKPVATLPAPPELVERMAAEVDVLVTGVGDCGSCSAAAIADAVAFERRDTPAAVVCTDVFRATADAMAAVQGAPGYRYATVAHPMAGLSPDEVRSRAEEVAGEVASLLVRPASERDASHHAA